MLHILYGSDSFTAREVVRQVLDSFASDSTQVDTTNWIDGRTATQDEILQACEQVSMFGDVRRVVVDGLLSRFGKADSRARGTRAKGSRKKSPAIGEWEDFAGRVRALPDQSLLILLDGEIAKTNPLLDALASSATVHRLDPPRGRDLLKWIYDRVALHDGRIEHDAADRLASLVGSDLWQLHSEIRKLASYSDGAPITVAMIDNMLASAAAPSIFMLVDAVVERNERLARHRIDELFQKGLSAGYVFTMVARQLRLIALVRETRGRRDEDPTLPGELAALQPFALQRATQQAERYTESEVGHALKTVLEADRAIKTGTLDERTALDMLVTSVLRSAAA